MRKTKIICTLGPASAERDTVEKMIAAGMDVARFNFSHGTYEDHARLFATVSSLREQHGLPVGTMMDTQGPEIRLGLFAGGRATLRAGDTFTLCAEDVEGDATRATISHKNLWRDVVPGTSILLDDGLIALSVLEVRGEDITCTVLNGGDISNRKGVNVPGAKLSLPYISAKDREDILFAVRTGFEFIAASFVRTAEDIMEIRTLLEQNGGSKMKIIAKIESGEGVENIDDILRVCDGIMVARGDMGVEIPLEDVPIYQKLLIKKGYTAGKHVIIATQMLESMMVNPRPTRAETSDVANAIYDGTSAIMLSGESASGRHPVEAVATMARIAERIERDIDYYHRFTKNEVFRGQDVTQAISHATCTTAYNLGAAAIVSVTQSGSTARMCSRFRPSMPIVACTPQPHIFQQLSMSWGVCPVMMPTKQNTDDLMSSAVEAARERGIVKNGDLVVITAGVPLGVPGTTNLLKVAVVGDVLVRGTGLNSLTAVGNACVARSEEEALLSFKQNDILVIRDFSDGLLPLLTKCSAVITESPDPASPAATVGLELGIPVIVGAKNATGVLKSGTAILADAGHGLVSNAAAL